MRLTAGGLDMVDQGHVACSAVSEERMANPGQPTISIGATGDVVKRLERALRRTPDHSVSIDGVFGPQLGAAVKLFQEGQLTVDGIVGPETWAALPDGGPMPTLRVGSTGAIVSSLQTLLTNGASEWNTTPQGIDGNFGPHTKAAVVAFQAWGGVAQDGIVGDQTWAVPLGAANATLESAVGLQYVIG
jgi:peptidoglycan hydrolase-like protein with peptidoglycan-binding domain